LVSDIFPGEVFILIDLTPFSAGDRTRETIAAADLVSDDACYVSRRVFTNEAVYAAEKRHIFGRNWLYLCHESQLVAPGDFLQTFMCETPVIVARGEAGAIHASINSCSHRGLPVCRVDRGTTKRFICPYHNWSYGVDGRLAAIPQARKVRSEPDRSRLGLPRVPRLASYAGLVFGCFDAQVENLDDYLGDMRFYLDTFFGRFPGGVEVVGAPHKWLLNANWKLPVENQLGDVGHGPFLHATLLAGTPAATELEDYGHTVVPRPGHGAAVRLMPEDMEPERVAWGMEGISALNTPPELKAYLLEAQRQAAELLGQVRARIKGLTYGVYPNLSFLWSNATIRVSHPRGPGQVEYWSWWVVPRDAPPAYRQLLRNNYNFFFGPGGVLEQEDSDAWTQQYQGSRIDFADDRPYFYGLGTGEEGPHPELPGTVGSCYNEHYARSFYRRWRADLEAGEART